MKKNFLAGVIALGEESPTRFANVIRNGWPEIKAAVDQGHSLKVIHQRLVKGGVQISYRLFTLYVRELLGKSRKACNESRKVETKTTAPGKVEKSAADSAPVTPPQTMRDEVVNEIAAGEASRKPDAPTDDPWGNVRKLLYEKQPGFQWDEDVPETDKLY